MKTCIDCEHLCKIANTDESRQGICSYSMSFAPVCIDNECIYTMKPYTCKDCDHYGNDYACFTVEENDPICGAFIDKKESEVEDALYDWAFRGFDVQEKLNKVLEEFKKNYKPL